jgi:hypothetical protein
MNYLLPTEKTIDKIAIEGPEQVEIAQIEQQGAEIEINLSHPIILKTGQPLTVAISIPDGG